MQARPPREKLESEMVQTGQHVRRRQPLSGFLSYPATLARTCTLRGKAGRADKQPPTRRGPAGRKEGEKKGGRRRRKRNEGNEKKGRKAKRPTNENESEGREGERESSQRGRK